jgi:tagatose 1,6-diphosphate aldolase GatY/KbaY
VNESFRDILEHEQAAGRAVGAFTCYDLATALGVLRAAESTNVPVIILISAASFTRREGPLLMVGLIAAAAHAPARACVELDHVSKLRTIEHAIELGVGAVMADGSRLTLEENARLVTEAARIARRSGAGVEAELGHIEGGEDIAAATRAGALTEPDEALRFIESCSPDCLAVSIGNVHGQYAQPPNLDWQRLAQIRDHVETPLSLHGASGLPESDLQAAVAGGIAKVNINTELRRRAFRVLADRLSELAAGYRMLELQDAVTDAAAEAALETLRLLCGNRNLSRAPGSVRTPD